MEVRRMRQIAQVVCAGLGMVTLSTPAFAQAAAAGGLNLIDIAQNMSGIAIAVAVVLFVMSFWSVGVAIERVYTYNQARKQSKLYAPQVAKHLKDGRTLATIGSTAPFVGLLGTVVGVINAFVGIASTGSGGIGAVSAGIAEALIETALGLFVAIPAVWFYNFLTSRIEYFNVEMDNSSSELVDYFIKKTAA